MKITVKKSKMSLCRSTKPLLSMERLILGLVAAGSTRQIHLGINKK
jgi:hypothetical protein